MRIVFKCKECETGPCYCEASNPMETGDIYQKEVERPYYCPYNNDENCPEWESLPVEVDVKFIEEMSEWLAGDGWEIVPEKIRDVLICNGLELNNTFWGVQAMHAMNLLNRIGADLEEMDWEEAEKTKKLLNKRTKLELMQELLPNGFAAGIIYTFKMLEEWKANKPAKVTIEMYERKRIRVLKDITWSNYNSPTKTLPAGWEGIITRYRPGSASAIMTVEGDDFCICDSFLEDGSVEEMEASND